MGSNVNTKNSTQVSVVASDKSSIQDERNEELLYKYFPSANVLHTNIKPAKHIDETKLLNKTKLALVTPTTTKHVGAPRQYSPLSKGESMTFHVKEKGICKTKLYRQGTFLKKLKERPKRNLINR